MQETVRARKKRQTRVRKKVMGTVEQPRLNVYRSNAHIYAQVIDDASGVTLVAASDLEIGEGLKGKTKSEAANEVGKLIAKKAVSKKIGKVVFDRGGRLYHGRVRSLADGAREGGLEF
jgi:large subunit ribosomal protein L18